jgi:lysozyme family protein
MASFEVAYKIVREHEGGYANDKDDTGGETYKGIARNHWPNWKGWAIVDRVKLVNPKPGSLDRQLESQSELQALVLTFFKTEFWNVLQLDLIKPQPIATEVFDTSVNMGIGIAAVFLQDALNIHNNNGKDYADLKVDGKIGPVTVGYINNHTRPGEVLKTLNILQGARYIEICKRNPRMEKFYRSWLSRVSA